MISLLTTGGTIACTTDDNGALIPTVTGERLAAAAGVSAEVEITDLIRLDSSSVTLKELDQLVAQVHAELAREDTHAVVITHGTDSLEDTAAVLDLMHPDERAGVILTGAQRAFDRPDSDGPTNLADAVAAARTHTGVLVAFGGELLPARGLRKAHTDDTTAFASNPAGTPPRRLPRTQLDGLDVPIVAAYPGADARIVEAAARGADGLVIQALGAGNMPVEFGRAVAGVLERGVPVVVATRVPFGQVRLAYGGDGGGATLARLGAVGAGGLSAGQARMALLVALASGIDVAELL